jgi:hypothetical protein
MGNRQSPAGKLRAGQLRYRGDRCLSRDAISKLLATQPGSAHSSSRRAHFLFERIVPDALYRKVKHGYPHRRTDIPSSRKNPKILRAAGAEIVRDRIARSRAVLPDFLAQEGERRRRELPRCGVALVVRRVPQPLHRVRMRAMRRDEVQPDPARPGWATKDCDRRLRWRLCGLRKGGAPCAHMGGTRWQVPAFSKLAPLILSFSPWEKGRLNGRCKCDSVPSPMGRGTG